MPSMQFPFKLFVILSLVQVFRFFVSSNPIILTLVVVILLLSFKAKLMFEYPMLAAIAVGIYVLILIGLVFWALLLYLILEALIWWGLLFAIKDWLKGRLDNPS